MPAGSDSSANNNAAAMSSRAPLVGIACMVVGGALLTRNDAVVKWLSDGYPVGKILFIRGLFVFIPVAVIAWRMGGMKALTIHHVGAQTARALLTVISTVFYLIALTAMPLADVVSIAFAGPLFLTALAVPLLGEPVGWRRWSAVLVGFAGILVMFRPGSETLHWVALLPLIGALLSAFRDIITRRLTATVAVTETSVGILCYTTLGVTLAGLTTFTMGWRMPALGDMALLVLSGFLIGAAQYLLIEAFRLAQAGLVAPFRYANVIWAVLFGFLIWGDLPDRWMLLGSTLVIGSGLYIFHRETRVRRRA